MPNLMLDISENSLAIYDISTNKIPTLKPDISKNTVDISQNTADIEDISTNKNFIQQLQSVDYSITLANAPAQCPTPVIQSGYNAVVINSDGINIMTQNFGPSSQVNSSILQINSEDTTDETIKIITKGLYFKNATDNSTQLIISTKVLIY